MNNCKILLLDIETAPILASVWGLFDQTVPLNQIKKDWHLLSFSAKWLHDPASKIIYHDQRNVKDITNDKPLLNKLWKLLDEAQIVVGQNSNQFDLKKINARFIIHGMKPPSNYRKIDTMLLARKHFGFTSNKLEYLTNNLCVKYKKLVDKKFSGFKLWDECMKGNIKAWDEMERYNKLDVLSLEEVFLKLYPWDNSINFNTYTDKESYKCNCGSTNIKKKGFAYTNNAKYQRYICNDCGANSRGATNLLSKEKKKSLMKKL